MNIKQTHYRTCNLCEAMCGLEIRLEGDQIVSIKGDKEDPFSRGHICPKAVALQDIYHDPDRLKRPVRRTADGWEEIGWEEAFAEVATGIGRIQEAHGRDAVAVYQGNPNVHNWGTMLYGPDFVRALRTKNRFSATSADQLPHHFASYFMYGHQLLIPIPDIDRTDFFLLLGANPLVSNGSLMTAAGMERRLKEMQQRGGQLIVVDPRQTATARLADRHHFIRPGSDVLLLLALVQTMFADGLTDPGRLADFSDGFDEVEQLTAEFTPERVAPATGIAAAEIRRLAHDFSAAPRAVCYGRMGVSTQAFGGLAQWLIQVLNILSGNLDRPGGAMFTLPALDVVGITTLTGQTGRFNRWQSRVRGLPEFGGELPVAVLAEEILTDGPGQIRGLVTVAGNPVLSTPNGGQLDQALAGLEFMAAVDIYINETTRHANIILPPTTGLETSHFDLVFHIFAVRNTAKYSPPLFEPAPGTMHDWQIFRELRRRLGRPPTGRLDPRGKFDFSGRMKPEQILDLALRFGPYGSWNPFGNGEAGLKLRRLQEAPHGLDLGPLKPCLPGRLAVKGRRIRLAPPEITADLPRARVLLDEPAPEDGRLWLIGRRQLRSNNSWMHNSARLVRGKERCTLLMNPEDADRLGLENGVAALVTSRTGCITLPLEISAEMMPGVVSIPHGWGHDRSGVHLETARTHPGASINDLTDEQLLDGLTGNAAFNGVPVQVRKAHHE